MSIKPSVYKLKRYMGVDIRNSKQSDLERMHD